MNDDFSNIGDDLNYLISIAEKYFNRDISSNTNENDTATILTAISNYATEMQSDRIETIDFTPVIDALNNLDTNVIVQNNIELQTRIEDLKKDLDISLDLDITPNINISDIQTRLSEIKDLVVNIEPNISDIKINADVVINENDIKIPTQSVDVILNVLDDISTYLKPVSVDVIPNIKELNIEPINVQVNPIISDIDISPLSVNVRPVIDDIVLNPLTVQVNPVIDDIVSNPLTVQVNPILSDIDISPLNVDVIPVIKDIELQPINVDVNPVINDKDLTVNVKPVIDVTDFEITENIKLDNNINRDGGNKGMIDNPNDNIMVALMNDNNKLLVDLISRIEKLSNIQNASIVNNNNNNTNTTSNISSNVALGESKNNTITDTDRVDYTAMLSDISRLLSTMVKSNKNRRFSNDLDI